ncbi:hypothetical protein SAMN05443572_103607 [Myxococcus fulvus]|uniref:Uncharacterized protein n=1 Tax=Myxococcus fulvus TaxID=33 RepID=A0A511TFD5_MYXFU|nr:hypothetical protein [Myxococcus fulvus]AKF81663.1 hypothetical protein MFUL124B02_22235 [Myxococcus fulvus 124B02]GEN12887.1 hypothetical protein MFU01_79240 [Myxococcus fulvus]SET87413.1 hypothetical protein SAMN05443572_103607 [Myxococcus fulvus]
MPPAGNDEYPDDPLIDEDRSGREGRASGPAGFVPEFVRRMAVAGLGALFMTEEGIRNLAGQLKLPKEALGFILSQAEKTKDEVTGAITEELRRFLQSEKLRDEFLKLVSGMTLEIKAQVRLVPPDKAEKLGEDEPEQPAAEPRPKEKKHAAAPTARVVISELNARRPGSRRSKKE